MNLAGCDAATVQMCGVLAAWDGVRGGCRDTITAGWKGLLGCLGLPAAVKRSRVCWRLAASGATAVNSPDEYEKQIIFN